MASSQDTEITLGTAKLLVLFFGLVGICALFFALGYSLGRKSETGITTASAANSSPQMTTSGTKPAGSAATPPMTFYKAVEQKDANPELTPAVSDGKTDNAANGAAASANNPSAAQTPASAPDPSITIPSSAYNVQVAAVSKQEDADALVDALKKKQYQAFVAPVTPDKLFRVQVGPFLDVKEAEATRARLISDGYTPIVKK
jgi:DedD protein